MRSRKWRLKIPISFAYWVEAKLKARKYFRGLWHATRSHSATVQFRILARIITPSWLMRPKKKSENQDTIRRLGQSLTKLAIIYAVAIWLVICITGRA